MLICLSWEIPSLFVKGTASTLVSSHDKLFCALHQVLSQSLKDCVDKGAAIRSQESLNLTSPATTENNDPSPLNLVHVFDLQSLTCRLVMVSRRASSDSDAMGTMKGLSGICSSLNLIDTS